MSSKIPATAGEGSMDIAVSGSTRITRGSLLETAVEADRHDLYEKPAITSGDTNKSLFTTSSYTAYKRSVSPDTMLQGATSESSISGVGYPMYRTFTTFKNRGLDACTSWLRYWVVFGWLALLDVFFNRYLKQWTVYWSLKIVLIIYLLMPLVKGADLIYRDFIKNFNRNIEFTFQYITGK